MMSKMPTTFILREMTLADGPAINVLASQCPDGGGVSVRSVFRENAWQSLVALRPDTVGVAAEAAGHDGLIGMGLVSFGHCRVDGVTVPYALLNTLMVHPKWRRQGVAGRLADWRIEYARSRLGAEGLLLANIQAGNEVSHRMVRKWATQVLPAITVAPVTVHRREPKVLPGVTVGPVKSSDMEEFTNRLNAFYEGYNLFQPETADSLSARIPQEPLGLSIHHCLTVTDQRGHLLAGLALEEAHRLRTYHVVHMPVFLRIANRLLRAIPSDGILREILVNRFWFRPGKEAEARYLWQRAQWECRNRGTSLMAFFDPRSPLTRVIHLKPWSIRTSMNPVIRWQTPLSTDRLISPIP